VAWHRGRWTRRHRPGVVDLLDRYRRKVTDHQGDEDRSEELAPTRIDCIDCGGVAHLLSRPDDTGRFWPGDLLTYRCEDCLDRWDLIIPDDLDNFDQ